MAGVTKNCITILESGRRKNRSVPVLERPAKALGVPGWTAPGSSTESESS